MANYPYKQPNTPLDEFREALIQFMLDAEGDFKSLADFTEALQAQLSTLVLEGSIDPETAQARIDAAGVIYTTLKERMDTKEASFNSSLSSLASTLDDLEAQKADRTELQQISLSYKESYATLAALQAAYPTGDIYNHTVLADGLIYTYKTSWLSTGLQANGTGIADGSITKAKVAGVVSTLGKNLFDKLTMTIPNYGIDNVGTISPQANWTAAKIPALANTEYAFKHSDNVYAAGSVGALAFLDSSSQMISYVDMATLAASNTGGGKKLTTPANTAYIYKNVIVLARNYLNTFQIELGADVTPYAEYQEELVEILGLKITDTGTKAAVLELETKQNDILYDLYAKNNDNENFGIKTIDAADWYSTPITLIEPCTNDYLKGIGIVNWVHFDIGQSLPSLATRDLFFKRKYTSVIKGKHYQIVYYIETGDDTAFTHSTVFASTGTGFTQIFPTETIVTPVAGEPNLFKIRKSGSIPTTGEFTQLWIGSSFTNNVISTTPALSVGGFYSLLSDSNLVGTDSFITTPTVIPLIAKNILDIRETNADLLTLTDRVDVIDAGGAGKYNIPIDLVIMGDSITADPNWWTVNMLERLQFNSFLNMARSGATWSHLASTVYDLTSMGGGNTADNVIWNQVNRLIDKVNLGTAAIPSVVLIVAGTNDFGRPKGDAATAFSGPSPVTGNAPGTVLDVAAAIRYSCELLLTTYPDTQIILATPLQRGMDDNAVIFDIGRIIKECAAHLSVSVIDQGKEAGVYGKYEVSADKYFYDNLHPNALGNEKIGAFMANKLKNLIYI